MTIKEYLKDPSDYNQGVLLYEKYGKNMAQLNVFKKRGDTQRNRENLIYELSKLAASEEGYKKPVVMPAIQIPIAQAPADDKAKHLKASIPEDHILYVKEAEAVCKDKEEYMRIEKEWKTKYREASHFHAQLKELKGDDQANQRKELAFKILDHFDDIIQKQKLCDLYKEHGKMPDKLPEVAEDPEELIKHRNNLRTYISKAKKGKKPKEKIPQWQAELDAIEIKLQKLNG